MQASQGDGFVPTKKKSLWSGALRDLQAQNTQQILNQQGAVVGPEASQIADSVTPPVPVSPMGDPYGTPDQQLVLDPNQPPDAAPVDPNTYVGRLAAAKQQMAAPSDVAVADRVAKGSGLGASNEDLKKINEKNTETRAIYADPTQWAGLLGNAEQIPAFKEQRQGLDDLQQLVNIGAMHARPAQLDLSPLMDLTNAWSKNGYKSSYQAPPPASADLASLIKYNQAIQNDRRDLTKTQLAGIGAQKAGTMLSSYDLEQIKKLVTTAKDPAEKTAKSGTDQEIKWGKAIADEVDRNTKQETETRKDADEAISLLKGGSVSQQAFKSLYTKLTGHKYATALARGQAPGNTGLFDRLEQAANTAGSGMLSDTNAGEFLEAAQLIKQAATQSARSKLGVVAARGTTTFKFSPDRAKSLVYSGQPDDLQPGFVDTPVQTVKQKKVMSDDERAARIRELESIK